jgi:steroid 5-alpha reductase family enzyme
VEILIVYLYLVIQMVIVWALYRWLKNPGIVDVGWELGLVVAGLIYLTWVPWNFRLTIIALLLILWGVRLGGYIFYTRILKGHVEKRYFKLTENWKVAQSLGFFLNFQLQGVFILVLSIVFLFAARNPAPQPGWLDWIGVCIALIGIVGETVSDWQLYQFQQHPVGKICQRGLWNYSRHPNYFFEWIIWCGFSLFALHTSWGWIGLIAPLTLYLLMTRVTGPVTEECSIASRGEAYSEYQKTTNMFFPGLKRN